MFGICALPAVALFFGMLRMPESPRWLVEKGRDDEALAVLKTVRSEDRALAELAQVEQVTEDEKTGNQLGFKEILPNKWLRRILFVGIGVSMTQQLTGINSIMYYGTRVLEESGFSQAAALLANTVFGLAAVIGGIIALRNMDRLDRRKTFFIGLHLTTICHCLTAIAGMLLPEGNTARPYVIAVLVTLFVLSMQSFLNIAIWVWLAEIFPLEIRGLAIGIAVFFGWFVNGLLALYVPTLLNALGLGTFFLFAAIGVIMLGFLWHEVPETRRVPRIAGRGSPGRRDLQVAAPTRSLRSEPSLTLAAVGHAGQPNGHTGASPLRVTPPIRRREGRRPISAATHERSAL